MLNKKIPKLNKELLLFSVQFIGTYPTKYLGTTHAVYCAVYWGKKSMYRKIVVVYPVLDDI